MQIEMKKNIFIIILFNLFMVGVVWGQEFRVDKKTLESVVKFLPDTIPYKRSKDTITIFSESNIILGKIRHNTVSDGGNKIQSFVIKENREVIIEEPSSNITEASLTVKPGNIYDFFKEEDLFLTIRVVSFTYSDSELVYDLLFISEDSLVINGDTLAVVIDSLGLFSYETNSDTLLFIHNWPAAYQVKLKNRELIPTLDNRLCSGDTLIIQYDGHDYMLAVLNDDTQQEKGVPLWILIPLVFFVAVLLIWLLLGARVIKALRHNVNGMEKTLLDVKNKFNLIQNTFKEPDLENNGDINQSSFTQPIVDEEKKDHHEESIPTESEQKPLPPENVELATKGLFRKPKLYVSQELSVDDIINGIKKNRSKLQEKTKQLNRITDLIISKDNNEDVQLQEELSEVEKEVCTLKKNSYDYKAILKLLDVADTGVSREVIGHNELEQLKKDLGEIGTQVFEIRNRSIDYMEILGFLDKEDKDKPIDAIKKLVELKSLKKEEDDINATRSENITIENNSHAETWEEIEQLFENNSKVKGNTIDEKVVFSLEDYLDVNHFRKMLHDDTNKETLGRYILDTLGKQNIEMFSDANRVNTKDKDWDLYIKEKCEAPKEPTKEQKNVITREVITEAKTKTANESEVVKALLDELTKTELLENNEDKTRLSQDAASLHTIAEILNGIPRNKEEWRSLGAKEVLKKLQDVLGAKEEIDCNGMEHAIQNYFETRVDNENEVDRILQRKSYRTRVGDKENAARNDGEKGVFALLQSTLMNITKGAEVDEKVVQKKIGKDNIQLALEKVFNALHNANNGKDLEAEKRVLLKKSTFEETISDLEEAQTASQLISKLVELVEKSMKKAQQQTEEKNNLQTQLITKEKDYKDKLSQVENSKQKELTIQRETLEKQIRREQKRRKLNSNRWRRVNNKKMETIKEYHLAELTRIKKSLGVIDEQLKAAYSNYDRNTPLGKLIDSSIRKNIYYSFEKFLDKVEGVGDNSTETTQEFTDSLRVLYRDCLSPTQPTWIDVLARLYCYTNVPYIAKAFDKAGLDCQAVRQCFFQIEQLLRDVGINITYPRLFKDRLTDDYELRPERSIDSFNIGWPNDEKPGGQKIIDLYTVGFQISDEDSRKPVVSI